MWVRKYIQCPICGSLISKMGGGFAGHWGVAKCSTCDNVIDIDTEMLAAKKEVKEKTVELDASSEDAATVEGEADVEKLKQLSSVGPQQTIFTHHATAEGTQGLAESIIEAFQPQIDSANCLNALITYYAGQYTQQYPKMLLTADVVERVENGEIVLPELAELVSLIANKVACLQAENERKDKLIELYRKQGVLRKQYKSKL